MRLRAIFAKNLKAARLSAGLSQEALAAAADLDRTYVSHLEREVYSVSLDKLEAIARVLKVDPCELLRE